VHRDDLERLRAERDAADRAYNDALTRLDRAIQPLPADFPQPPPVPDEHQVTPLNTLWQLEVPVVPGGLLGRFAAGVLGLIAPVFERQQAFNAAVVDHVNRNVMVGRQTRESIASTLVVLRDQISDLARFQSLLIMFLQQITPYVDTRDRDVAGLLRGFSGAINGVADELMKRTEALVARDERRAAGQTDLDARLTDLRVRVDEIETALRGLSDPPRG
jgi:hypothetical protein